MNMQNLGDALDTLSEAYWHIELIAIACRYDPGSDAKAFAAVTHTALKKLEAAKAQIEDLWRYQKWGGVS
ncbi:hypothetical protein [Paracoccus sp. pheM1]|uniref:hypothetical protein n=1 Tax=Paracoccus sp. pheM1 TaxID=2831675 RepID=UPI001BDB77A6|nr:hypothetical protein [Paracoccus sp. pheM1]MBT0779443.1 hypothetical protein [Paracoccus sp. pheM1]